MRDFRPRLLYKGVILLFVPLVFEIAVAACLIWLQYSYGEAVNAEALRKEIVGHIDDLWGYNGSFTVNHLSADLIKDLPTNQSLDDSFSKEYEVLAELFADDPAQLQRLTEIKRCHLRVVDICAGLKSFSLKGDAFAQAMVMHGNRITFKQLIAADLEFGDLIREFREHEQKASDRAAEKVRFIAWLIGLVLFITILGGVLIAYGLFHYFMHGIHKGIRAMILNIKRFKMREPLTPPLAGTDEIALLDARFHEMAEAITSAQQLKQSFMLTVSDQLKVPICSIRDYAAKLSAGSDATLSEVARSRSQKVVVSLQRLIGLMDDLLALQDSTVGRMRIVQRQCSLTDVIQLSMDAVVALAEKSNIRLQGPTEQISSYADADRIVQVLVNLLSNAIKFSKPGSSVTVSATLLDRQVEVQVKDTGRGIPPHMTHSIFEKFQQVSATDATEKGGTGLGLPICKEIIDLHGGTIGVDSEEGRGSVFWFRLPAINAAEV